MRRPQAGVVDEQRCPVCARSWPKAVLRDMKQWAGFTLRQAIPSGGWDGGRVWHDRARSLVLISLCKILGSEEKKH